jgi:hypothetical protein
MLRTIAATGEVLPSRATEVISLAVDACPEST